MNCAKILCTDIRNQICAYETHMASYAVRYKVVNRLENYLRGYTDIRLDITQELWKKFNENHI